jgi:hypothetical protein
MANGQNQLNPPPIPPLQAPIPAPTPASFNLPGDPGNLPITPQSILNLIGQRRPSFTELTFPSILPLLTPQEGITPEVQEAIQNIQRLGQEGIERGISRATTEAQRRGLTGSSIEAGQIGEAQRRGELDILGQITPLIAAEAERKQQQRTQTANFLMNAFGVDFSMQTELLDKIAQGIGEELGRQTQLELGREAAGAAETAGIYQGIGGALGGLGSLFGGILG